MIWAVGDIHGCYFTLIDLLSKIKAKDASPRFVFVGDYADRGANSKQVVDLIIELISDGHYAIRGNHDDVLDFILNGSCKSNLEYFMHGELSRDNAIRYWNQHGFIDTQKSYGISEKDINSLSYRDIYKKLEETVPQNHKDFFNNLPLFWENEKYFIVHGFLNHFTEISRFGISNHIRNKEEYTSVLWDRPPVQLEHIKNLKPKWGKFGIFGHTPVFVFGTSDAILTDSLCLIDTGVFRLKKDTESCLSAICLDTKEIVKSMTNPKDIY